MINLKKNMEDYQLFFNFCIINNIYSLKECQNDPSVYISYFSDHKYRYYRYWKLVFPIFEYKYIYSL